MRSGIKGTALLYAMAIAGALYLSGCARSETTRVPKFVTLETVEFDLEQAELQMEATQDALHELRISPQQDIPEAYRNFRQSVERMEWLGERVMGHANGMYYLGPGYFIESEKSAVACEIPRLRYRNVRRAELGTFFDAIAQGTWDSKHAFRSYQFDIEQLRDSLETMQNPRGVETVGLLFSKSQLDSASLANALERAHSAVERAREIKAQSQPPGNTAPSDSVPPAGIVPPGQNPPPGGNFTPLGS
jgi:hypothetical protein